MCALLWIEDENNNIAVTGFQDEATKSCYIIQANETWNMKYNSVFQCASKSMKHET